MSLYITWLVTTQPQIAAQKRSSEHVRGTSANLSTSSSTSTIMLFITFGLQWLLETTFGTVYSHAVTVSLLGLVEGHWTRH